MINLLDAINEFFQTQTNDYVEPINDLDELETFDAEYATLSALTFGIAKDIIAELELDAALSGESRCAYFETASGEAVLVECVYTDDFEPYIYHLGGNADGFDVSDFDEINYLDYWQAVNYLTEYLMQ